jgi:hypothetical protein
VLDRRTLAELEDIWEQAVADAQQRARAAGRKDIEDYLDLRRQNDLQRRMATEWLMSTFTMLAGEANRRGASIQIETQSEHRFMLGHATMVGDKLTLRCGVRALTVESGWPRTPRDGFIRGGGLARANLKHFGRQRWDAELLLVRSSQGAPQWKLIDRSGDQISVTETHLREHVSILLSDI